MNAAAQDKVDAVTARLTGETNMGGYVVQKTTWLQRLGLRLFPSRRLEPRFDVQETMTDVGVYLDLVDRLRVLVSGKVSVHIRTLETPQTRTSRAVTYIKPPGWLA